MAEGISITKIAENSFMICGDLAYQNIMDFIDLISTQKISSIDPLLINISKCEIEDGLTLLATVKTLRALSKHVPQLIIEGATETLEVELVNKERNISLKNTKQLEPN